MRSAPSIRRTWPSSMKFANRSQRPIGSWRLRAWIGCSCSRSFRFANGLPLHPQRTLSSCENRGLWFGFPALTCCCDSVQASRKGSRSRSSGCERASTAHSIGVRFYVAHCAIRVAGSRGRWSGMSSDHIVLGDGVRRHRAEHPEGSRSTRRAAPHSRPSLTAVRNESPHAFHSKRRRMPAMRSGAPGGGGGDQPAARLRLGVRGHSARLGHF